MIDIRLNWFLEQCNLLHPSQSGFLRSRPVKDSLLLLHDNIYKTIHNKWSTIVVFLDLQKAYDVVWREGLLHKIQLLGISGRMLRWIKSFPSHRLHYQAHKYWKTELRREAYLVHCYLLC